MDNKPSDMSPQPRPVMDIQPPQQPAPIQAAATDPVPAPAAQSAPELSPVQDVTRPSEPAPAPVEADATTTQETSDASPEKPASENQPAPLAAQPATHKHSRAPMVAIVVAVLLAGVLGTFAFMAYTDSSKQPATATNQSQTAPVAKETVAPGAVDETNAAVDQSLSSVDDAADYNDSSLSDSTLGL